MKYFLWTKCFINHFTHWKGTLQRLN